MTCGVGVGVASRFSKVSFSSVSGDGISSGSVSTGGVSRDGASRDGASRDGISGDGASGDGISGEVGFSFCLPRASNRVVKSRTPYSLTASPQRDFPFFIALARRPA